MDKQTYLSHFHNITSARAKLGKRDKFEFLEAQNPLSSHQATRFEVGYLHRNISQQLYLGARAAYHDITDISYGFLRGTQIEFLNLAVSLHKNSVSLEKFTILSLTSITPISEFIKEFSWNIKSGWNRDFLNDRANFFAKIGIGGSFANSYGYSYFFIEPYYLQETKANLALSATVGLTLDSHKNFLSNFELHKRIFTDNTKQLLINATQTMRIEKNLQIKLIYKFTDKQIVQEAYQKEHLSQLLGSYFFKKLMLYTTCQKATHAKNYFGL